MESHLVQLSKHCRVCGKKLCKAKSKATVYPCKDHPNSLLKCFGVDISRDEPTIHPPKFCNPCFAVTKRFAKATADGVHYSHSVQCMEWSSHTEDTCMVRKFYIRKIV